MNISEYENSIKGRRVSVIGLGVSNVPLIEFLHGCGAVITARDKKSPEELGAVYEKLSALGVDLVCGDGYLSGIDDEVVFRSPGIRYDIPELAAAAEKGAVISSEMELFFELCPCPIIGITGSDGKTTTTTVTSLILKKQAELDGSGRKIYLGGNIGTPLIGEVGNVKPDDLCVVELSSFQLHTMTRSPHIAAITNITPNHLNWHTDMKEYIDAKTNIFTHQSKSDRVVLNYENDITRELADKARGNVYFFSSKQTPPTDNAVYEENGEIYLKENGIPKKVMDTSDIRLVGRHNVENYMTAIALTAGLVTPEAVQEVAREFNGVEHRLEFVRELHGVKYYNGSIDSSPTRTIAALSCFNTPMVVILGGYDKNLDYAPLCEPLFEHAHTAVLTGQNAEKIYKALETHGIPAYFRIIREPDFEKAIYAAKSAAKPGDAVILSPAAASFDRFKNFEERGKIYKNIV
ncbi:MAG: UDP-N-acetylmuramoyl-L-alanine--D-glutamate ligase, partial [Clostridia bacterium]|nr:UDP-N-acetylmuramoyl-L-alanine--D-glutamate ligase [Clostridia bacterium]